MRKPDSDWVRVPENRCLNCHRPMDALGTGDENVPAKPSPGDIAVCIHCGGVQKLDENLRLRGMNCCPPD